MTKISSEDREKLIVAKNALNSIHKKLNGTTYYEKNGKTYDQADIVGSVKAEFKFLSETLSNVQDWEIE